MVDKERLPRLEIVFWEVVSGEEVSYQIGQLHGASRRLTTLAEDLDTAGRSRRAERGLRRLEGSIERYLLLSFEVRERALELTAAVLGRARKSLQGRKPIEAAIKALESTEPELGAAVTAVLKRVQRDINSRNAHTHQSYFDLLLRTGDEVHDPYDMLITSKPGARSRLEPLMCKEVRAAARAYLAEVEELDALVERLIAVATRVERRSGQ